MGWKARLLAGRLLETDGTRAKAKEKGESHESESMGGADDGRGDLYGKRRGGGVWDLSPPLSSRESNRKLGEGGQNFAGTEDPRRAKAKATTPRFRKVGGFQRKGDWTPLPLTHFGKGGIGVPFCIFLGSHETLGEGSVNPVGSAICVG